MTELTIRTGGPLLRGERSGPSGVPAELVLLHGLSATRHYTVMGSRHLERREIPSFAYDARGHGHSTGASGPSAYSYETLTADLGAVLDEVAGDAPVVLHGISMGAHTAARFALEHPGRVRGLVLITPAFLPGEAHGDYSSWERLAAALRGPDPIERFIVASDLANLDERFRESVATAIRQRLGRHRDLRAVADAIEGVPRSDPFGSLEELAALDVPAIVVGSRDSADPSHPLRVAQAWADALPHARLEVEDEGKSPLAWQGGRLARFAEELVRG